MADIHEQVAASRIEMGYDQGNDPNPSKPERAEALRPELPLPVPDRMLRLHVHRGYPVPWFVAWLVGGEPVERGRGEPDFRIVYPGAIGEAHGRGRCWLCGGALGAYRSFVVGPMCAVNRTSAEPPSHLDCADWSARACPFLSRPRARRREAGMPDPADLAEVPGQMLARNPGVALVWTTRRYSTKPDGRGGRLFDIGEPTDVRWYCEGRPAARAEVRASIDSGEPALRGLCADDSDHRALDGYLERAERLLPAA